MKITIEYNDVTSSIELGDFDLQEFKDNLRGLLHTVWLPCQVDEIIPDDEAFDEEVVNGFNEFDAGHAVGYQEGHAIGYQEGVLSVTREPIHCGPAVPRTMDALTETVQKAGYYTDSGQEAETNNHQNLFQNTTYDKVAERVNAAQIEREIRQLEREIRQLEVAIYDLKTENNELRKDKERLDWLIDNTSISIFRKDEDGAGWWVDLDDSEPRGDIDAAMEESQ